MPVVDIVALGFFTAMIVISWAIAVVTVVGAYKLIETILERNE